MNTVLNLLASETWQHLTLTLLHTLWQGALAAVALYFVLRCLPASNPNARYAASLCVLGLIVLAALVTWSIYRMDGTTPSPNVHAALSTSVPLNTSPTVHASYHAPELKQSLRWTTWLSGLWLLGTTMGLLRAGRLLLRAGRVRRKSRPWDEPGVDVTLARLMSLLRVGRRVRVAISEQIDVPGVVGLLRPVVVFPAAIVAGMPPSHLDAILAHELAHIRRYDYWVNLCQLLVEALLFFNPSVWWISRRIRIEREACCDTLAASVTGVPLAYAAALAALAEQLTAGAQPALAATGGDDEFALLDRVKRLLVPGYRPGPGLSWYTLTALGLAGMIVLAGLSQGVFSAVALAAKALTPAERVEQIQALQQDSGTGDSDAKVPVSGTVRTEDGAPIPENFGDQFHFMTVGRCGDATPVRFRPDGRFEGEVSPGTVYAVAEASGYAFAIAGPFTAKAGSSLNNLEVVLRRGEPAAIRVTDSDGRGIPGAKLNGYFKLSFGGVEKLGLKTDPDGIAVLDHYAGAPISFDIVAEGYARDRLEGIVLDPRQPVVCELKPTRPTTGVATAEESGVPLAGLVLRLYGDETPGRIEGFGTNGEQLAVTDEQGHFSVNTLRDDTSYTLLAQGADGRRSTVGAVGPGQTLNIIVPPPFRVRGRITGDLSLLVSDEQGPTVAWEQAPKSMAYFLQDVSGKARVEVRGKEGYFETEPLFPGDVTLTAGPRLLRLRLPQSSEEVVIDLAPESQASSDTRTLVLRLQAEQGLPAPRGTVDVDVAQPGFADLEKHDLPFVNGEARVSIPVPSKVHYRAKDLAAYWAEEKDAIAVPEGVEPFVLMIPVIPAGAIHGRVLEADGSNAGPETGIALLRVKVPGKLRDFFYSQHAVVRDGSFVLPSIPLGVTCSVLALDEQRMVESEDILVDARNPIHEVTLQFVKGETIHGRVVDEAGKPMKGLSIGLSYGRPRSDSYGNADTTRSGPDGRFTIDDVNPDMPGRYILSLESRSNYVPVELAVVPRDADYVFTARKGLSMEGRVLDDKTGLPVAGAVITAIECKWFGRYAYYRSEAGTDQNGSFRFSNLVPGKYYFWVNGVLPIMDEPVLAGTDEPIVLRMGTK